MKHLTFFEVAGVIISAISYVYGIYLLFNYFSHGKV